ncbi:MAG: radical SAM/SPASM domain-containing protein [Promethearchaeota archaeon]|jgi:radical SAM protein with 4Fe4S-binding SPASM domain
MNPIKKIRDRFKYITLPWLLNRIQIELDSLKRKDYVRSYPTFLIVEPCNICNLKCPLCPTGQRLPVNRGNMHKETFTRVIDQLHRYVRHLSLFYLGEPLLCENLPWMIKYAQKHKIKVLVSSNLNILDNNIAKQLIDAKLDFLIVSLDGTSQKTYAKYRIGGNYDEVIKNISLLINMKRELKSDYPRVLIQFVIFKHNEKEIPKIKRLAKNLGVDLFFRQGALGGKGYSPPVIKDRIMAKKWLTQNKKYHMEYDYFSEKPYLRDGKCGYLWKVATINWDGSVFPCCWIYENKHSFGNILQKEFKGIWNNEYFRSSRRLFAKKGKTITPDSELKETICYQCKMYKHNRGNVC